MMSATKMDEKYIGITKSRSGEVYEVSGKYSLLVMTLALRLCSHTRDSGHSMMLWNQSWISVTTDV